MACQMPSISLVAWEWRHPRFIFVRIPNERGRYLRTDRSVAVVPCDHCKATIGEPCKHNGNYVGGTHYVRRKAAKIGSNRRAEATDIEDSDDGANLTIKVVK